MWWFVTAVAVVAAFGAGRWSIRSHRRSPQPSAVAPTIGSEAGAPAVADVLEELQIGIAIAGRDGADEFRNSAARAMAGTHAGVLIDDAIARHLARGLAGIRSDEVLELHGPPRAVFVVRSAPLPGGGAVSFVDDISERRRIDQVRTDFVANVSHELKTPVGALSVLAETLQDEHDLAIVHRLAGRMMAEAERASNTIDDLMELSRIELGGDRDLEPVRLADVVHAAIGRVSELAARLDITVTALDPVDAGGPRSGLLVVEGDRRQLVSAVGNLVENAVKYSPPGESVQVRVRSTGDIAEISVVDHGIGIPAADIHRVFERFYRVDQARSRSTGGTGLGLSIARHVATSHRGDVVVESQEGSGSIFTLRLPLAATDDRDTHDGRDEEGVA